MSREDSGVIDLFAICARPSASPAGDLRPPDLFSVAPPAFTTDIVDDDADAALASVFAKKSRTKLALAAGAAVVLVVGLVFVTASGASAEPAKASAGRQLPPAAPTPLPDPAVLAPPAPPAPRTMASQLPAPPTTGAPVLAKAPPRVQPAAAVKARAAASGGPKMTKVQSGGVASH